MKDLRSGTTTQGRKMAGARSLWRANGMKDEQIGQPVIAVVNSFTQFVPGHVHLHEIGQQVKQWIEREGCFAAEFNTIAIDDGIAMGHDGMLYSLPSRDLIADSVEYMCNAHKVDAMVCISNCDKITPGMLMAAMRLNIPTVFVSGGPMEAGRMGESSYDLIDVMVKGADASYPDKELDALEHAACPTCGSCSGMFTANSMNCLTEALGLSLPGNGTVLATHEARTELFRKAAKLIVKNAREYYFDDNDAVLPRSIATRAAFLNAMSMDIAMGGSSNTVLHLLAVAHEAGVDFTMSDIDRLSRRIPVICKVAPNSHYHIQDVNRAGGILSILGELNRGGLIDTAVGRVDCATLAEAIRLNDLRSPDVSVEAKVRARVAPAEKHNLKLGSQNATYPSADLDREKGCIRDLEHPYLKDGGLAVLFGNIARNGCIVKTAGVDESILRFEGKAGTRLRRHSGRKGKRRRRRHHPLRGSQGRSRHAGNALPDLVSEKRPARQGLRAGDRRTILGRHVRTVDRTRIARSGGRRRHRAGTGRRPDRHRHTEPHDRRRAARRRTGPPPRGDRPLRTRRAQPSRQPGPEGLCVDGHVGRPGRSARRHLTKDHSTFYPSAGHPRTTAVPDGSASGRTSDAVKTD